MTEADASGIEVFGLSVDLGGRRVLTDVALRVRPGEFVGLLGPNGAGKTTLLRSILDLVPRRSGVVRIDGSVPGEVRSLIGYVPQRHEFAWDFPISVEEVVLSGRTTRLGWLRRPGVLDIRAADRALDRVGMAALRRRPVGELSGGQRQRVLVARALAAEPSVLLLDEPFTGLDMPSQELLGALFVELVAEGRAILMTTHEIASALDGCSRLCLINGRIVADGGAHELTDPRAWMEAFEIREGNPLLRVIASASREKGADALAS